MSEQAAERWGSRALAMVRTTAQAIADVADEVLARAQRNLASELESLSDEAPSWMRRFGKAAVRASADVAVREVRDQLDELGVPPEMIDLVDER